VVVTPEPDALLERWQARDHKLFMSRNGAAPIKSFLHTPRAVRVWYNTSFRSADGRAISPDSLAAALAGTGLGMNLQMATVPTVTVPRGTRLQRSAVLSLSSVIVVVDANRVRNLTFAQLTDYVGMVGLAEVNVDADVGSLPTILNLFRDAPDAPRGLSVWDESFLASLYGVDQASAVQEPRMKTAMLKSIAP
jgi:hypothetical protein